MVGREVHSMLGVGVCFLISLTLFLTLGPAFEARERRARLERTSDQRRG
jgi:hypothetical protein